MYIAGAVAASRRTIDIPQRSGVTPAHRLGLKRALPCPVVSSFMLGGRCGYCAGKNRSNTNSPPSYGVSSGPAAAHQTAADILAHKQGNQAPSGAHSSHRHGISKQMSAAGTRCCGKCRWSGQQHGAGGAQRQAMPGGRMQDAAHR